MTKTTSYEISKKLKEAGFKAETNFYWYCYDNGREMRHIADADGKGDVEAYDLETLLDALPDFIANKNKGENCLVIDVAFGEIHYEGDSDNDTMFITTMEENESLADVAGKMWLMLKEKGIV